MGRQVTAEYDPRGRVTKTIDGAGNATVYHYNGPAWPYQIDYPNGMVKTLSYDVRGRLTGETITADNKSLTRTYAYDAAGNLAAVTDEEGRTTAFARNELGLVTTATDPAGGQTRYAYDYRGNVVEETSPSGHTTYYQYDKNNRLVKKTRPLQEETVYTYDPAGNLTAIAEATGHRREYTYDAACQMTVARYYGPTDHTTPARTVNFTYNALGNLVTWDDGLASGAYTYDALGRKLSETVDYGGFSLSYAYTYYANGLKKTFTGPDGNTHQYTYDGNNRLVSIFIPGQGYVTDTFDAEHWNSPAATSLPGGTTATFTYDGLMRVKSITANDPTGNAVMSQAYEYSDAGNLTAKTTESGSHAYQYDLLDRLTQASSSSSGSTGGSTIDEAYTYDADGNRLTSADRNGAWTYNENNELLSVPPSSSGAAGATGNQYDDNGNLVRKTVDGVVTSYVYSADNRLTQVWNGLPNSGALIAAYYYDPFGRRLWKEVDGVRTHFLYSDEGLIGEYDAAGAEQKTYGWRPDTLWGTDPLFLKTGGQYYWFQNDNLGIPQKLVMSNGLIAWDARYDAFGNAQITASGLVNNLRLPGMYADAETGLYYNYQRYYDPEIGRYITTDPYQDSLNLYVHCYNNPGRMIDPFGLCALQGMFGCFTNGFIGDAISFLMRIGAKAWDWWNDQALMIGEFWLSRLDSVQAWLDAIGWFDPTGIADGANTAIYALRGQWGDVGISFAAIVGGDFLKGLRYGKKAARAAEKAGKIQKHHKVPWTNKTYNHQNHPLVRQAGENIKKSKKNLMDLGNHAGSHSSDYHQGVQDLMDDAYEGVAGKGKKEAQDALNNVYDDIEKNISDGTLKPYGNKDVWIP